MVCSVVQVSLFLIEVFFLVFFFFGQDVVSITVSGVPKSPAIIVLLPIFACRSVSVGFTYLSALMLFSCIFIVVTSPSY